MLLVYRVSNFAYSNESVTSGCIKQEMRAALDIVKTAYREQRMKATYRELSESGKDK